MVTSSSVTTTTNASSSTGRRKALVYGLCAMACSMLHCVFVSFYIDYFVRGHMMTGGAGGAGTSSAKVSHKKDTQGGESRSDASSSSSSSSSAAALNYFIIGQIVYAVWNALNDLGFGWLSDTHYRREGEEDEQEKEEKKTSTATKEFGEEKRDAFLRTNKKSNRIVSLLCGCFPTTASSTRRLITIAKAVFHRLLFLFRRSRLARFATFLTAKAGLSSRRLSRVAVGGPLWALSFAWLWAPPTPLLHDLSPALDFSLKMIVYDGFFSYTTVSFRALLTDISACPRERERCNAYAAVFHVIGSVGVLFASLLFEEAHGRSQQQHGLRQEHTVIEQLHPYRDFRAFCWLWAFAAACAFLSTAFFSTAAVSNSSSNPKKTARGHAAEVDDEEEERTEDQQTMADMVASGAGMRRRQQTHQQQQPHHHHPHKRGLSGSGDDNDTGNIGTVGGGESGGGGAVEEVVYHRGHRGGGGDNPNEHTTRPQPLQRIQQQERKGPKDDNAAVEPAEGEKVNDPQQQQQEQQLQSLSKPLSGSNHIINQDRPPAFFAFVRETLRRPTMVAVLVVWFLQDYSCTFATNFFSLFLVMIGGGGGGSLPDHGSGESALADTSIVLLTRPVRAVLLLLSFVLPHAVTLLLTPILGPVGKKRVITWLFVLRGAVGIAFFVLLRMLFYAASASSISLSVSSSFSSSERLQLQPTPSQPLPHWAIYAFAVLLLLNRVLTEAVCRLQGLILSDVCDEDTVLFKRPASMAGALHGIVNLASRPAQSLAPVLSCVFLAQYGVLLNNNNNDNDNEKQNYIADHNNHHSDPSHHRHPFGTLATAGPVLALLIATILTTTTVMAATWRRWYRLDGPWLKTVHMEMALITGTGNGNGNVV